MDINVQIKILEALLKQPDNRECADCLSKTPRWASITFGAFVCLRCSGQHRQLQVHIAKIKSVNLDAWKPEVVELYKHMNNTIVNSYWEAKLPKGYQKPGQNASSAEVNQFIRDKYVNKRWIDTHVSADPATLWMTDKKKFDKYVRKLQQGQDESEDDAHKKKKDKKKKKKSKHHGDDSDDDEEPQPKPQIGMISTGPPKQAPVVKQQPIVDLINLDSIPSSAPSGVISGIPDGFSEFQEGNPVKDGFDDFQTAQQPTSSYGTPGQQSGINIQNVMNLYSQNPSPFQQQQQPMNKYSALDALSSQYSPMMGGYQQPQQMQQQQQQYPQYQMNQFGQQQQMPPYGMQQQQRPGGFQTSPMMGGGQQTNMFNGLNMTINVNQYGQMPQVSPQQTQPQQQFNPFAGMPQTLGGGPAFKTQQQPPIPSSFQQQTRPQGGLYGGLVDLSNLGGSSRGMNQGFGSMQSGFMSGPGGQPKKSDAFSGLMSGQW